MQLSDLEVLIADIDPQTLASILQAGASRAGLAKANAALAQARAKSESIITAAREALQPQLDAIDAQEAQHRSIIAAIEAIKNEFEAIARFDSPDFTAMVDQIA